MKDALVDSPFRFCLYSAMRPMFIEGIAKIIVDYALPRPAASCAQSCGTIDILFSRLVRSNNIINGVIRTSVFHSRECPRSPGECAFCIRQVGEPGQFHSRECIFYTHIPCGSPDICYSADLSLDFNSYTYMKHVCGAGYVNKMYNILNGPENSSRDRSYQRNRNLFVRGVVSFAAGYIFVKRMPVRYAHSASYASILIMCGAIWDLCANHKNTLPIRVAALSIATSTVFIGKTLLSSGI